MRGEKNCHFKILAKFGNNPPNFTASTWVKASGRLIKNENFRLMNNGTCDVNTTFLAARKFLNFLIFNFGEIKKFFQFLVTSFEFLAKNTVEASAEFKIFINGESFIEDGILKNHANLIFHFIKMSSDILTTNGDATGVNL